MRFFSLHQREHKTTQIPSKSNVSLEKAVDSICSQRRKQITNGLSKTIASTGTPMKKLHGAAKKVAQMSNIGGGSKATGGGGVDEGMKAILQYTQAITAKKMIKQKSGQKKISRKK